MKKKILVLGDHPLSPSGVGSQTKYFIEALLETGRYSFLCLGGAIKHQDYTPQQIDPWGEDWRIFPIDGYGNHEMIRSIIQKERPDVLWFMTDPRFYGWLWEIENEIRANMPMVYYHVWDNWPAPVFNANFYRSTDEMVCISKVTYDVVRDVAPDVSTTYLPHAVDPTFYHLYTTPEEKEQIAEVKDRILKSSVNHYNKNKKIFFWNSRNARRKQSGTLVWWFKEFLDEVGHDKASLLMHTDPRDPHGTDLPHIIEHLGVNDGQVLLSTEKVAPNHLANLYNAADFTVAISDAEGFGLSMLESLSCGTPIIATMTGGMQEQVYDGTTYFGYGIEPVSKSVIGSLQVPYIYEDRIGQKDFNTVMKKALEIRPAVYKKMAAGAINHVASNYSFKSFKTKWIDLMDEVVEKHGSWETRKGYDLWRLLEVA